MTSPTIPLHHLDGADQRHIAVERILPSEGTVHNDVHRHDFHELFLFVKGSGTHMIDLHVHAMEPPCLHSVEPGQVHQLVRSADTVGVVFMFGKDALADAARRDDAQALAQRLAGKSVLALDSMRAQELLDVSERLEAEVGSADGPVMRVLENYLGIALAKCAHWANGGNKVAHTSDAKDLGARFKEVLERSFIERKQVAWYAQQLSVTPGHLNDQLRSRAGTNASVLIHDRVLLEAKRLLLHADLSVKEVSFALGMQDPAYFNRWFKKAEGSTPVEYRAHVRALYKN